MKILLTGMTSSHSSKKPHQSNLGFYGVLEQALLELGHEVIWSKPDINWTKSDLDIYDAVFVGLVPPTSLSANQVYGALTLIDELFTSPNLYLVIDNPKHWLIKPSLKSVLKDPTSLVKPFYQKRTQYLQAKEPKNLDKMLRACERLLSETWPITVYPSLPWKSDESVSDLLPSGASTSTIGLNFDTLLIKSSDLAGLDPNLEPSQWVTTDSKSKWATKLVNHVVLPIKPLKASKKENDLDAENAIRSSIGLLAAPQDRIGGTWWTASYAQAMTLTTPIATEWREAYSISPSWAVLPSRIEELSGEDRIMLALRQKEAYLASIPSKEDSLETLQNLLQTNRR
jgi:hypothetical protein